MALRAGGMQLGSPPRLLVRCRAHPLGRPAPRQRADAAEVALAPVTPPAQPHLLSTPLARKQSPRLFGSHSRRRTSASFSGQRLRSRPHHASVRSLFGTIARRLGWFRPGPSLFSAPGSYASGLPMGNFSAALPVTSFGHEARSSPDLRAFCRPSTGPRPCSASRTAHRLRPVRSGSRPGIASSRSRISDARCWTGTAASTLPDSGATTAGSAACISRACLDGAGTPRPARCGPPANARPRRRAHALVRAARPAAR
jgi:hypothetical protein